MLPAFPDGMPLQQECCADGAVPLALPGMELPPALGLSRKGNLYLGGHLLRAGVASFGVRAGGAGGPYLLAVTRDNVLHTLPFSGLLAPEPAPSLVPAPAHARCAPATSYLTFCSIPTGGQQTLS